jgi:iron complex outermembrane recepter protein
MSPVRQTATAAPLIGPRGALPRRGLGISALISRTALLLLVRIFRTALLLLLYTGFASVAGWNVSPAHAQTSSPEPDRGTISGEVRSTDGSHLPGVEVLIVNAATGAEVRVQTSANGRFRSPSLPANATYTVEVTALGYQVESRSGVPVTAGEATEVEFALPVDAIALEGVVVSDFRVGEADGTSWSSRHTLAGARTRSNLMELPQSVNIVNERVLADFGATESWDAVRFAAPGISLRDRRRDDIIMRGFRTRWTFMDGVINRRYYPTPLFNVDRVEVIKGPAALLYGQNSPNGGFLNYVTKVPQVRPHRSARLTIGEHGFRRGQVDLTGPVTEALPLAYRMVVGYEDSGTFRELDGVDQLFVSPSLTWFLTDRTSLTASYTYTDDDRSIGYSFIDPTGQLADLPLNFTLTDEDHGESSLKHYVTGTLLHDLNPDWSLRVFGAVNKLENERRQVRARGLMDDGFTITRDYRAQVQDIRDFDGLFEFAGRFDLGGVPQALSAGAEVNRISQLNSGDVFEFPTIDIRQPQYGLTPGAITGAVASDYQNTWQNSAFLMNQASFFDERLRAVAGLRYIYLMALGGADKDSDWDSQVSSYVARRLGLLYQPRPELSIYVNNSDTFQPNAGSLGESQEALPPSVGEIWELGARVELLDGGLTAGVALFDIVSTNNRMPDFDNPGNLLLLDQENRGVELEVLGQWQGWQLGGNFYRGEAVEPDGSRVERVSDISASLFGRHDFLGGALRGFYLGGGLNYMGDQAGSGGDPYTMPSYTVASAFAGYRFGRLGVSVNANNLTDTFYIDSSVRYEARVAPPRHFRVGLDYAF